MKRAIFKQLLAWKTSQRRKPLILQGARQVGKTYILKTLGEKEYPHYVYVNFEEDPKLKGLFEDSLNPRRVLQDLSIYLNQDIQPEKTLIIFDEIQECPNALNSLKYFNEQANEFHIAAAGSLLGIKLKQNKGFPVGKVNFLELYPLTFFEFLNATDKAKLRELLEEIQEFKPIAEPLHQELINALKQYFFVGGMPEAVAEFHANNNLNSVREIHQEILNAYLLDFAKHAPPNQVMKITAIWELIPGQLAKENKKFIFSALSKSARAREYETALQWLADAGLIYKSYNISTPKLPLERYADKNIFKVFLLDVGLLSALCRTPAQIILDDEKLFSEFYGAFTENFVAQELASHQHKSLYYWTSEGIAEVDFIIDHELQIYPLEVKKNFSKKKKSLIVYGQKYQTKFLARASLRNLKCDGNIQNYPLYMVCRFPELSHKNSSHLISEMPE